MDDVRLSKVNILIQQNRFAEAETVLRDLLATDPNNVGFLAALAEVALRQDHYDVAEQTVDTAIGLEPYNGYLFAIKARIAADQDDLKTAQEHLQQAISLDPSEADHFAWLAHISLLRKQYQEALDLSDQALALEAENLLALNTRSTTLLKLDAKEESFDTIEGALREDPNNAYTHANYGWGLLEKGDHKKALEHFKESLKSDPNQHFAQSGMLEAIKASNPFYRAYLKYVFWIGNLTARYQWGVIIGFYLAFRALRGVADNNPTLSPYLTPLIFAMAIVAFSTWVMTPIGDLFLRFNKFGKLLLPKHKRLSSNFVAASLGVFLVGLAAYFGLNDERFITVAAFGFAMMLPLSVMFNPGKNQRILLLYTVAMGAVGITAISQAFLTDSIYSVFSTIFMLGFIGFQWVANFFSIRAGNR